MQIQINPNRASKTPVRTTFEFHISRRSRDYYEFEHSLFSLRGDTIFVNFHGAHLLTNKINKKSLLLNLPKKPVRASDVYAIGLVDEIFHYIIGCYLAENSPFMFEELTKRLEEKLGKGKTDKILASFAELFPSSAVYQKDLSHIEHMEMESDGIPNRHIILEEMIVLWLGNANPAYGPVHELIDDAEIEAKSAYKTLIDETCAFFKEQPPFGTGNENLIDILRAPALLHPGSIRAQLEYIQKKWGATLSGFLMRLLKGIDFISEEEKIRLDGPGQSAVPVFTGAEYEEEYERFSQDLDWMPNVVIIAKNAYVWLDQLSKKYRRQIDRLDHIPDTELDWLASSGFTGLWLIGLWERSRASRKIKQICGNPEAVASAYSLHDYVIAADLGGEEAYKNLFDRAMMRGIRLASDMVPNHMAVDSRWTCENPDWFIQTDHPPFPSYSFNGTDLSDDSRVGIFIEDGYWNKTDAAVVFKHIDHNSGRVRYIYHGNDGTQMPWNDTAQLNYLKAEVREAVIQTIIHVARMFPIIRFDAAMTLAKRHYQRLWYPQPGSGGDIPSRAEHAVTKEEFNRQFPLEFWREVVDRIHREAPDTLLMAEAFWMMEGYFVRTLGMHRVYNSAFMNMLKDEDNRKLRQYIKNVIEFNPQILKRYVNFMSNPDEETAVAQFGKDDKYFGTCAMMATMPGLPMFGHGQVEGFHEKYGMEYRRAYRDENPDEHLVWRHEREIFPLLKKRYLFSGVEHFLFYDFTGSNGNLNEDVFAYSNGRDNERSLFVYNNRFSSTAGWIKESSPFAEGGGGLLRKSIADGLQLIRSDSHYCIFQDHITGLEYIRKSSQFADDGIYIEIGAFKYHVFLGFQQVESSAEKPYAEACGLLDGSGVQSIEETLLEIRLRPVHNAFREAVNPGSLNYLANGLIEGESSPHLTYVLNVFSEKMSSFIKGVHHYEKSDKGLTGDLIIEARHEFRMIASLVDTGVKTYSWGKSLRSRLPLDMPDRIAGWRIILVWLFLHIMIEESRERSQDADPKQRIYDLRLEKIISESFAEAGLSHEEISSDILLLKILLTSCESPSPLQGEALRKLISGSETRKFLEVNSYQGVLWFSREKLEELLFCLFITSTLLLPVDNYESFTLPEKQIDRLFGKSKGLEALAERSGYSLEKFLESLGESPEKD